MRLHYQLNTETNRHPIELLDDGYIKSVEAGKTTIEIEGKSFEH